MGKVAIFGAAGTIGHVLAAELERRGTPFRLVGRNRAKLEAMSAGLHHAEVFPADLMEARSARAAAEGVASILFTVGVPYTDFALYPRLMRAALEGAGSVRMLVVSSVYSYGVPQTRRVAETHPRQPVAVKGRLRKEQEDLALAAGAMVVRLPDFYGPGDENSLAHLIFTAALAGKTANWLGPASTAHEFLYVPDAAQPILDLATYPECYGEAWNLGGAGEISGADFIQKVYLAAGREPKFRTVGRTMLKLAGIFNPLMRELPEMLYLQETPVILDDTKLQRKLGEIRKTPYDQGIRRTLEWMRNPRPAPVYTGH